MPASDGAQLGVVIGLAPRDAQGAARALQPTGAHEKQGGGGPRPACRQAHLHLRHARRQHHALVVAVRHDHDADGAGGQAPRVLPRVLPARLLRLKLDAKHPARGAGAAAVVRDARGAARARERPGPAPPRQQRELELPRSWRGRSRPLARPPACARPRSGKSWPGQRPQPHTTGSEPPLQRRSAAPSPRQRTPALTWRSSGPGSGWWRPARRARSPG